MHFLKEIRAHLGNFETQFEDELHRFIDHLETLYVHPTEAIPAPKVENNVIPAAPVEQPVVETPVAAEEPSVEPTPEPAPVVESTTADPVVDTSVETKDSK
jgi:hypothetical protein